MSGKRIIGKVLGDIRFWIVALALLRLYGIANPPLESSHSWRQTSVTMVARNFYEVEPNIFYPRIDIGGDLTGITGMEFPLLNWLIYLVSLVFGYGHWYGRLINLVVSSVGCWYFYRLLRRFFCERHAFCATLILCASVWFPYARKIMPDTFSMSLVMIGMYYGIDYLYGQRRRVGSLIAYSVFVMLGVLSKLPSGYILVVFLLPMIDGEVALKRKVLFASVSMLCMVPVGCWYYWWVPRLVEDYGFWHFFMGKGIVEGTMDIVHHLGETFHRFSGNALKYIGFVVSVIGLVMLFVKRERLQLRLFGLAFAAFMVVVLVSGDTFYRHEYYVVPFAPVMAMLAGYAVSLVDKRQWRVVILVAIVAENVLNHHRHFIIREVRQPVLALEQEFDRFSSRDALICINSGQDPTVMYFTHRKGWGASNEQLMDSTFRDELQQHGCKYVLVMKQTFGGDVDLPMKRLVDNSNYTIYGFEE